MIGIWRMNVEMSEVGSYLKINYALRPAKNIERKMIAEACGRLSVFCRVCSYRYIGFGSTFYSDFTLFHRVLGCTPMFSIQKNLGDQERFNFNVPLGCVTNQFGESSDVLPKFPWEGIPTIVWLDYDEKMDVSKLDDIGYLTGVLHPSSVLIVTVRSKGEDFGDQPPKRLDNLREELRDKLPQEVSLSDVVNDRFHNVMWRLIDATVNDVLARRNSVTPLQQRIKFEQIFYFTYADTTPMMTVGGLFVKEEQHEAFSHCDFQSLDFYKSGADAYNIYVPSLTYREQRHLDRQLPGTVAKAPGVPTEDLEAYAKLYRYFPYFVEAEL